MKILAALDHSAYAGFVLHKAIKTARQQGAKMDIVVVVEEPPGAGDAVARAETEAMRRQAATRTARAYRQRALDRGVAAKSRVLCGPSAAEEIVRYQRAEDVDLVVVGRRARSGRGPVPMGPVARAVVADATCTVMVVRAMRTGEPLPKPAGDA